MTPFRSDSSSWYRALRAGAWLPIAFGVAVSLVLAGLHYYQQEQLRRASNIVRELGRAKNDLSLGFLHFTLAGGPDAPWQRAQGYALLTQALQEFERSSVHERLEPAAVEAFRSDMQRFQELVTAVQAASGSSALEVLELRLAFYRLTASADRVDRLLIDDLSRLRYELGRVFGVAFASGLLLFGAVFLALQWSRRRALAALRMLESLSSISTDAIFAKDTEGRYLLFNKEASRIAGVPISRVIGRTDREIFGPEQWEHLVANDRRVMAEKVTRTYEEELTTADGARTYLSTKGPLLNRYGAVVGVFGISRDISERKAHERAVQESREQLEAVIESLNEGLLLTTPRGEFIRVNKAAMTLYDYPEEWFGDIEKYRENFELRTLEGEPIPFEQWPLNRVLRGEHLREFEVRVHRRDKGWTRIHSFGGRLLRSQDGEPLLALLMVTDVTPRHQAEEALRRTQRMEALGELAAGIAHDFNNLLMAMAGNARLAQEELPSEHAARRSLEEILRASSRASDLVRSILLFSRAEEPQRRTVSLASLVDEALALVRPTTPSMIRFSTHYMDSAPLVNIDPSQMHQVIVNLVTNSVYAIVHGPARASGGLIEITLDSRTVEAGEQTTALGLAPGRYVHAALSDNGAGMDAATLAKIFDPFFTTKPAGQGTGLGMSVVHGIVRNHDGAITVHSEPGVGTCVDIFLPAAEVIATPATPTAPAAVHSRQRRVLYIDDEEPLVYLAQRFLSKRGHIVSGFIDPLEAVRAFSAQPDAYDVVITDMSMPTMSGFEVAQRMLTTRPDIAILMMSGYVRAEDRDAALALGVKDLLLKPSSIDELADAIDRQLA